MLLSFVLHTFIRSFSEACMFYEVIFCVGILIVVNVLIIASCSLTVPNLKVSNHLCDVM